MDDLEKLFKELEQPVGKSRKIKTKARRIWLNKDKGKHAFAVYHFEQHTPWSEKVPYDVWAELEISDCNRIISLELGFDTEAQKKERLAKLDRLSMMIAELRALMEAA